MELDLNPLKNIALKTPRETQKETKKSTSNTENAPEGKIEPLEDMQPLQREADKRKAERERALDICKTYQQNISRSDQLQSEILKGAKEGESVYSLLLKAAKAISLMTSNPLFYSQLEGDIKSIYGEGLLEPYPLQMEIQDTQERLRRLREASQRDGEPPDSRQRIEAAIKAHEARARQLSKEQIEQEPNQRAG